MRTIWKYKWDNTIDLPVGARILTANLQNDEIYLWAIVNPSVRPTQTRHFVLLPTGSETIEDDEQLDYINTVFQVPYVWHLFEKIA